MLRNALVAFVMRHVVSDDVYAEAVEGWFVTIAGEAVVAARARHDAPENANQWLLMDRVVIRGIEVPCGDLDFMLELLFQKAEQIVVRATGREPIVREVARRVRWRILYDHAV